jgi:F-type H+-transporting ATPase subunit b
MQIDWFTVIAQVVNFLVLVWLLKHFLYGRIVDAMKRREEAIAARMAEADRRAEEAAQESESHQRKIRELDEERGQILAAARDEAQSEKEALLGRIRTEVDELGRRWRDEVERERESFLGDVRRQMGVQVSVVARRALEDLAGADLEKQAVGVFIERLRALPDQERSLLADSCREGGDEVTVLSAFDLAADERGRIEAAVREVLGKNARVRFERDAGLICGVALVVRGRRVAWSIDSYLDELETRMNDALTGGAGAR